MEADEIQALRHVIELFEAEAAAKKAVKEAIAKLEQLALAQYPKLTTDDIQLLVIDDKWGCTIRSRIGAEVTSLGQALVSRLRVLADRYDATVGQLEEAVAHLNAKVATHLSVMGVEA